MQQVTVIIPNLNGKNYIREALISLKEQTYQNMDVTVVDNASTDGSCELIRQEFPWVKLIVLDKNYGFCGGVNAGIRDTKSPYVVLFNNDMKAHPKFVEHLVARMETDRNIFSCQAKMLQMDRPEMIDDAGDFYCALGWAFARGKNCSSNFFSQADQVFSACGGAVIYRKAILDKIGLFDEAHFDYLEDVDLGFRAKICGYENWYEPSAVVYHKGSASTGSRYNRFKVEHSSANSVYLIYKNMSRWQILINLPFFLLGYSVKFLFFLIKGMGHIYLKGLWKGVLLARQGEKFQYLAENFDNSCKIQLELWMNILRFLRKNK